ncbi:hypothetical protein BEP19_09930 [Ammoniphilus oxalaticus]|uniref:Uncharacterized protein n=1 Tax=Ammoniphilus oxalaticus TaxID=66863 RepID=A0A419SFL1_9BACL|nr:hypothetical protein [Ammoniphilus oxalaticus]RKD22570.1 hypothetical protein BEP19_09930 [Ammoniphilus oxalaticus]
MEIIIEVKEGIKQSRLEMNGASTDNEKLIIEGFFSSIKGSDKIIEHKIEKSDIDRPKLKESTKAIVDRILSKAKEASESKEIESNKTPDQFDQGLKRVKEMKAPRPKTLPLLGASERSAFSLSETADIKTDNETIDAEYEPGRPEHWDTGIKVDEDGTERYKCRYWCYCGKRGNRYIPLGTDVVHCHDCELEIDVEAATDEIKDGIPARNDFGNFFEARA